MKTRFAYLEDLPLVAEMCLAGLNELSKALPLPVSEERLMDSILENWAKAPCILLEDEEVIGFYGLTVYTPFYSEQSILGDYMLYIKPEKRSYRAARMLSLAARDIADEAKLSIDLHFVTDGDLKAKSRFLENMGAEVVGVKAIYRGNT